jgi:hypothetical protein
MIGCAMLLAAGCRNTTTQQPPDLSMGGSTDMAGGADMAKNYKASDVKTMRQGKSGDFVLANLVAIAVSPSASSSPRIVVQDASGGDFSAIQGRCSPTSTTHPCSVASTVKTAAIGDNVTLQGTFEKSSMTGFETFYIDMIAVNSHGMTLPAVQNVALTDVQRGAKSAQYWFQHVSVTSPGTMVMYDFTPVEFKRTGSTSCPQQFGFGIISSGAGAAAATACSGMVQPPGVTTPNMQEVLVGTDFYSTYTVATDCACDTMFSVKTPAANSSTTVLGGILLFDSQYMAMPPNYYSYLAPLSPTADVALAPVN